MKLNDLRDESYKRAMAKGFYDPIPSVASRVNLIHSEVSEALEAYRNNEMTTYISEDGKPLGFPSEIADVVIRICDFSGHLEIDLEKTSGYPRVNHFITRSDIDNLDDLLAQCHSDISDIYNRWVAYGRIHHSQLSKILVRAGHIAFYCTIDLESEIRVKSDYNETRPYKHGKTF